MKMLIIGLVSVFLAGCATLDQGGVANAGFTYATIKQIETGRWTSEAVLKEVARIREISNQSAVIDTDDIINSVLANSGIESPADRYLVSQFLGSMQQYVINIEASETQLVRLGRVLDAVETGARLAQ